MAIEWNEKQQAALDGPLSSDATYILGEGGGRCVAGDTIIDGHDKTIKELAEIGQPIMVMTTRGLMLAEAPFKKGACCLLRVELESGKTVEVTPDHRFWDGSQWVYAKDIAVGSSLAVRLSYKAFEPPIEEVENDTPYIGGYELESVSSVSETDEKDYYTLHVHIVEEYFANGILHHNSGKTFLFVRCLVMRALKAPGSRHAILRYRFNHVKQSIVLDTFPKVMRECFPDVQWSLDKTDWYAKMPGNSEIWFGGLDDAARVEKILGKEFVSIYLNEVSQIMFASFQVVLTRLAQKVMQVIAGKPPTLMKPRLYADWNPTNKGHWAYKTWHLLIDPDSGKPLANPQDYASFKINPIDNQQNLSEGYMNVLNNMSARMRKRFRDGDAADATPNALFNDVDIEKWRHIDGTLPDMVRVVVGVDPSGADDTNNADNDAIGIVVAGLGVDGNAYVLEDCTVKAGPNTWGNVATTAWERHEADIIVGEQNYGGAMVKFVIQTARPRTPYKIVTATRGKVIRAEPFSSLYEQGKVRHCGNFPELEEELCAFSTAGYTGEDSPNRADALIWCLTELFSGIVAPRKLPPKSTGGTSHGGWMAN